MFVSEVLKTKGTQVVSMPPDRDVGFLLSILAEHRIGAVLVSSDGSTIEGIVSERDVVTAVAERGAAVLQEPVSRICTTEVRTVAPDARLDDLMRLMTEQRVRHVPVCVDGRLMGIVSIGDVVKRRLEELEAERSALTDYITSGG